MSIPVSLQELPDTMSRYGSFPYLITVAPDATPHATSATVQWSGERLLAGAGRQTVANLTANGSVALLWPPPEPGDYTLIVDGWGVVEDGPQHGLPGRVVLIQPKSAILHVTHRGVRGE